MGASLKFFERYVWKEPQKLSPLADENCDYEEMVFWRVKDQQKPDHDIEQETKDGVRRVEATRQVLDQVRDRPKINELMNNMVIQLSAELKKIGMHTDKLNFQSFVSRRVEFKNDQEKYRQIVIDWLRARVEEELVLIRPADLSFYRAKYKGDINSIRSETKGKSLYGEFSGAALTGLEDVNVLNSVIGGTVNNAMLGTVDSVSVIEEIGKDSFVKVNRGLIERNLGTVSSENRGVIRHNAGLIQMNFGEARVEINIGIIRLNDTYGVGGINVNAGKVEAHKSGVIQENKNEITYNHSLVVVNNKDIELNGENGIIQTNGYGKVALNRGRIETNQGRVVVNENYIPMNQGRVENNKGSVDENYFKVEKNYGVLKLNKYIVETNKHIIETNVHLVEMNDGAGQIGTNGPKAVIISNKGKVRGEGIVIYAFPGGDLSEFRGEIKDDNPAIFDVPDWL